MIRPATPGDLPLLPAVERAAGEAFRGVGMEAIADDAPLPLPALLRYQRDGRAWVAVGAADRPVGYLLLDAVDGCAHVEQVSVHPGARGRGLGASLLDAAQEWSRARSSGALTLSTFADVAWNAPYYRRLGFLELAAGEWTPGLRAVVEHEAGLGLDRWPRVVMRRTPGGGPREQDILPSTR